MKFTVQTPPASQPVLSVKEKIEQGLLRIRDHYAGKEGETRMKKLIGQSLSWTVKCSVVLTGLMAITGAILCALFATTDDWKLLAAAMHLASAENLNNLLHHELMPQMVFLFVKLWAFRVVIDLLLLGFPAKQNVGLPHEVDDRVL